MAVVMIQSGGLAVGGGDVTPGAVNWDNIVNVGSLNLGVGYNAAQTISAVTSPIQLKAAWTSTSSVPAKGVWIKNGTAVGTPAVTPVYVNASVGDSLYFWMKARITTGEGNHDTGTVTVTNESDGAASLDTFTFDLQYVPSGAGGGGGDPP